jgi:carbon monoxide dehydrogenase subunit G
MDLTNDFRVALPIDRAWAVLTDLERIAPCMPGAQLQEVEGDEYRGVVKIKVGPITAQYKGQATFLSRDEAAHVAVLRAEGRETRGQGSANATITATLRPDGDGTAVSIVTDLTITGRVAQFGRGVLADVSANLLGQFVDSLEQTVLVDEASPAAAAAGAGGDGGPSEDAASEDAASEGSGDGERTETEGSAAATDDRGSDEGAHAPSEGDAEAKAGDAGAGDEAERAAATGAPAVAPAATPAAVQAPERPAVRKIDHPEPTPVSLVGAAGTPVAKRVGPVLAAVALVWLLKKLFGRSK